MLGKKFKLTVVWGIVFIGTLQSIYAQYYEGVCRMQWAAGFKDEYEIGHTICGTNTSEIAETKIYLTTKDGHLYAQSNYIVPGYDFTNPSKVASAKKMDLEDIAMNVIFAENPSRYEYDKMKIALKNDFEIIIDPKLLDDPIHGTLDFSDATKINIYCPDGTIRPSIKIKNKTGGYDLGIKYNEQISTRIKENNINYIFSNLKNQRIEQEKLKIVSLIENSSTKKFIADKFSNKALIFDYSSKERFKEILLENKGNRTIILGHVEEGNFVTVDRGGKEIFRISINEIQTFQKENDLSLIIVGCNSGESGVPGPLNKFNSIDVLRRLEKTEKTENIEQFLDSLAFRTLHFVLDETFFRSEEELGSTLNLRPERLEFQVYSNPKKSAEPIKTKPIGRIILLGIDVPDSPAGVIPVDTSDNVAQPKYVLQPTKAEPPPESRGGRIFLYIMIGFITIVVLRYLYKSSNEN